MKIYTAVDQREIQRLGGICVSRPFSCLLREVVKKVVGDPLRLRVIDLTYGRGTFYVAWRPRELWGIDIAKDNWEVPPDKFINEDFTRVYGRLPSSIFDVVFFDPPYMVEPTSPVKSGRGHYIRGSSNLKMLFMKAREASIHLLRPGGCLIAKIMDPSGSNWWEYGLYGLIETMVKPIGVPALIPRHILVYRYGHRYRPSINSRIEKNHVYLAVFSR